MNEEKVEFQREEGYLERGEARVFYRSWIPDEIIHTMVIVHGLGEHSGRYENPAKYFCPKGYAVYAIDNRGHGNSSGKKGHVDNFNDYRDDLAYLLQKMKQDAQKKGSVFLVGHSIGGLIALSYILSFPGEIEGLILSSPAFRPKKPAPPVKAAIGRFLSNIWPTLTLGNEVNPVGISKDPEVVKKYIEDPLVHDRISTRFYTEFLKATNKVFKNAASIQIPILQLQAGEDLLVDPNAAKEFFERVGSNDKTLKIYEDYYHELFNEPDKKKVFIDMEKWIRERLALEENINQENLL